MKKKLVLLSIAILMAMSAPLQAQIKFGVKGGLNITQLRGDLFDNLSTHVKNGYSVGPMVEFMIPVIGLGFDGAALYTSRGSAFPILSSGTSQWETKNATLHQIDVPINLKWKLGVPMAKIYLAAGPNLSFLLNKDIKLATNSKTMVSLNLGAGVEVFNLIQIGINYNLGLNNKLVNYALKDLSENVGLSDAPNTLSITAAILF